VKVAVVIPAYNEATTVGEVARCARQAPSVDRVVVVSDGSTDGTEEVVRQIPGVELIRHAIKSGKGEALQTGARAVPEAEILVFLDADLTGFCPEHVEMLVRPVRDEQFAMACGLFDRGPFWNWIFLHVLPVLTGERALRREVFEALEQDEIRGYKVEAALNSFCKIHRLPVKHMVLPGMFHVPKEKKRGPLLGLIAKVAMLLYAAWSYGYFHVKRFPRYVFWRQRQRHRQTRPAAVTLRRSSPEPVAGSPTGPEH
jgi:glycosyltransferase involved in cell wall biosynthesis